MVSFGTMRGEDDETICHLFIFEVKSCLTSTDMLLICVVKYNGKWFIGL